MILGLGSGSVSLAMDHAAWANEFARERQLILAALAGRIVAVEHVGSTALPGVPAKPILDLLVGVLSFEKAVACVEPLEALGYEYRGEYGIARRHYFVKGDPRTHHLHMLEVDGDSWRNMLDFRDALRARPELAQEYCDAKVSLAARYGDDRNAYQQAKDVVIAAMLPRLNRPLR